MTTRLSAAPTSVAAARRFVREVLSAEHVADETVDTAELLTSEVVTNAIVHARSSPRLVVNLDSRRVRVEVHDASMAVPVRRNASLDALGGRGLAIIDELAQDWGVVAEPTGKLVWFELGG